MSGPIISGIGNVIKNYVKDELQPDLDAAATNAAFAEEFSGPVYATPVAGAAAVTTGKFFRVAKGTTPETYDRYERTGTAPFYKLAAGLATTVDLASTAEGKGAALVGLEGGGNIQAAINAADTPSALMASTSAFITTGAVISTKNEYDYIVASPSAVDHDLITVGGVRLYINHKRVSPRSFGAIGDGVTNDSAAVNLWKAYLIRNAGNPEIHGLVDGNFVIDNTCYLNLQGYVVTIIGMSMTRCGFTQISDNAPIMRAGDATAASGHPDYGGNVEGFFLRYANPQPENNTAAIAFEAVYIQYWTIQRMNIFGAAYGFLAPSSVTDNTFFSTIISNLKINRCSIGYFWVSAGTNRTNTGSVITNIYCAGNRADVAASTCDKVFFFERMDEATIGQLNAEWVTCRRVLVANRMQAAITSMHLEGVAPRTNYTMLYLLIGAQINFSTLSVRTVNFSGGDPETKTIGGRSVAGLFELQREDQGGASKVRIETGFNFNCVAATTTTLFAYVPSMWGGPQHIDVIDWDDRDNLFHDEPNDAPISEVDRLSVNITGATQANPCVITMAAHGFTSGETRQVYVDSIQGMRQLNGKFYLATYVSSTQLSLKDLAGSNIDSTSYTAYSAGGRMVKRTITAATNASPTAITFTAHSAPIGKPVEVYIDNATASGWTALNNNRYLATATDTNTMTLTDMDGVAVDTTAWGSFSGGARLIPIGLKEPIIRTWQNNRFMPYCTLYDGGASAGSYMKLDVREDIYYMYDQSTGMVTAPFSAAMSVTCAAIQSATAGAIDARVFNYTNKTEKSVERAKFFASTITGGVYYTSGATVYQMRRGDLFALYTNPTTTYFANSRITVRMTV